MNQPWRTCFSHPEPPFHLPPHPILLGCPRAPALSALSHASNLDWWSVSHMIIYMFQWYSLKSSHPRLLPQSPKVCSLHLCGDAKPLPFQKVTLWARPHSALLTSLHRAAPKSHTSQGHIFFSKIFTTTGFFMLFNIQAQHFLAQKKRRKKVPHKPSDILQSQ